MILSCLEDHRAMFFPHAKFQENLTVITINRPTTLLLNKQPNHTK